MFSCTMFMSKSISDTSARHATYHIITEVKHHAGQMPSGLTFQDRVEQIRSISDYRPIKFLTPYMLVK